MTKEEIMREFSKKFPTQIGEQDYQFVLAPTSPQVKDFLSYTYDKAVEETIEEILKILPQGGSHHAGDFFHNGFFQAINEIK